MIKTLIGYDIEDGVTAEEYERWLFDVHAPDILANPYVDRLVFNKVVRPVPRTSAGGAAGEQGMTFYRIAEMHFADEQAYRHYQEWFDANPIPAERGPGGRTAFRFYLLASTTEVNRRGAATGWDSGAATGWDSGAATGRDSGAATGWDSGAATA